MWCLQGLSKVKNHPTMTGDAYCRHPQLCVMAHSKKARKRLVQRDLALVCTKLSQEKSDPPSQGAGQEAGREGQSQAVQSSLCSSAVWPSWSCLPSLGLCFLSWKMLCGRAQKCKKSFPILGVWPKLPPEWSAVPSGLRTPQAGVLGCSPTQRFQVLTPKLPKNSTSTHPGRGTGSADTGPTSSKTFQEDLLLPGGLGSAS